MSLGPSPISQIDTRGVNNEVIKIEWQDSEYQNGGYNLNITLVSIAIHSNLFLINNLQEKIIVAQCNSSMLQ